MKRRRAAVAVNNNGDVALTRDHVGPSPLTLRKTVLGSTSIEHRAGVGTYMRGGRSCAGRLRLNCEEQEPVSE